MKRQGEVEAEYHAAHSYIQRLQDEISQVLDGILTPDPPPCSSTPSQPLNPPPPSEPSLSSDPHTPTPHPSPTRPTGGAENRGKLTDAVGRRASLEDVTNTHRKDLRVGTVSVPQVPPGPRNQRGRSFDAELYWTGRRISVEDSRHRTLREESRHADSFGRRRRTSLGEYSDRDGESTALGKRVGPLSKYRRSSLGDYQREYGRFTGFDGATRACESGRRSSRGELKHRRQNAPSEKHGYNAYGQTGKESPSDLQAKSVDHMTPHSLADATCASPETFVLGCLGQAQDETDEDTASCEVVKGSNFSRPGSVDQTCADITRKARELRNSITEAIDRIKRHDSGVQDASYLPCGATRVESRDQEDEQRTSRDHTTALCHQTKEPAACLNKDSAGTAQSSHRASARVASLCCLTKQDKEKEEKEKTDRDHLDHQSAKEGLSLCRHQYVADILQDRQDTAVYPEAGGLGQPVCMHRAHDRTTTPRLPSSPAGTLRQPHTERGEAVSQPAEPGPLSGNGASILHPSSPTAHSSPGDGSPQTGQRLPTQVTGTQGSSVSPDTIARFQPGRVVDSASPGTIVAEESDREGGSSADVRDTELQGHASDVTDTELPSDDASVKDIQLQGHTDDVTDTEGHSGDGKGTELFQTRRADVRDTERHGHATDVRVTERHGHTTDVKDTERHRRTTNVRDTERHCHTTDVRDTERHGHTTDVKDTELHGSDITDVRERELEDQQNAETSTRHREHPHASLQTAVRPPMTVCKQGVEVAVLHQDTPTDPARASPDVPLSASLPDSREKDRGVDALQDAALDPLSHREHHDRPGHGDLSSVSNERPLSQGERQERGECLGVSGPPAGMAAAGDVDVPEDAASNEAKETRTSASSASEGMDPVPGLAGETGGPEGGVKEEEGGPGSRQPQRDASLLLADTLQHRLLPTVQSRDAGVQTVSGSALSPAHLLPHVDTACQTSPTASSSEDLSVDQSADLVAPSVGTDTLRSVNETAEHEFRQDLGLDRFSKSSEVESTGASCDSNRSTDKLNRKQNFGASNEVSSTVLSTESKKHISEKGEARGHQQRKGATPRAQGHPSGRLDDGDDDLSDRLPFNNLENTPIRQGSQTLRNSTRRHSGKDKTPSGQRPGVPPQADASPRPRKPSSRRAANAEEKARENFRFTPDEMPEMQVMVNSLTPVLQRRRSARRSHSDAGVSSEDVTSGCEDLHLMLASFTASTEREEARQQAGMPEDKDQVSSMASSTSSRRSPQPNRGVGGEGSSGLFIRPKFARTWHGPMQLGTGRAAPKMGVTMMTSDPSALTFASNARAGGQGHNTHVHTMPVISRTLLDALHKRYCAYQYSRGGWAPLPPLLPPAAPSPTPTPTPTLPRPAGSLAAAGVSGRKLNSEGESDTGSSSVGTSSESSPRTAHSQATPSSSSAGPPPPAPPPSAAASSATSVQKYDGQTKKEEIEAVEACQWLRAAGFPQYAHMFEDGLFPVDIGDVQRDHDFLDSDSIQSVIRRLNILNTCSVMKIDAQPCKKAPEESDEEDQCALSSNWEYQKAVRRWSRKLEPELSVTEDLNLEPSSSHDSLLGEDSGSHTDESPVLESKMPHSTATQEQASDRVTIQVDAEPPEPTVEGVIQPDTHVSSFPISPKLRRAASERLKSALKKMESFKKKSKKYPTNRNIVEISDPVVSDQEGMQAKLERLNCVDISPGGGATTPVPHLPPPSQESTPVDKPPAQGKNVSDSSFCSPLSPISSAAAAGPASQVDQTANSSTSSQADSSSLSEYYSAHSQLLASFQACSDTSRPLAPAARKHSDSSLVEIFLLPQDHKPGSFPRLLKNGYIDTTAPFQVPPNQTSSTSSLSKGVKGNAPGSASLSSRVSMYDNLSPGSSQHTFSTTGFRKPENELDTPTSTNRQPQVLRSFSIGSGNQDVKADIDMSSFAGMVRSRSASAATSLEHQALGLRRGSEGATRDIHGNDMSSGGRKLSVGMEELDAVLQNLYRDINSLNSDLSMEEGDSQDTLALSISGSTGQRGVSFSIADHNGSFSTHSVHSKTDSVREDSQLSQMSASEGDSLALAPSSPAGVDDSMEGEDGDMSSQDSGEEVEESADETLERIIMEAHERRDSGVGSSLTRASRERTKKKIRWESFQKCHRPSRASRELQIGGLSVCQLLPLRQLSLLKLTSIMEKCSPTNRSQWSWSVPRFMKRHKAPQFSDKNVFGVPFTVMLQRTGQPLPQCVLYAMRYLRKTSHDAIGIFRKSGVRSRIQKLRDMVEACPDTVNFDELQPYDVADLLKQYFRELPECLLTNKLSDTFRSIFSHVPVAQRLEALQTTVVLLPEENREVLHCLLLFLGDVAEHADKHQMNASNLAVCFAPSLFNFMGSHGCNSPKRQRKGLGVPEQRELLEQKAVHECFTYMIVECKKLFMVPPSMYSRLHLSTLSNMEPVHLDEFYAKGKPGPDYKAFGEEHIQILLKEAHDKNRGWTPASVSVSGIEVLQRKPQDGHPIRQWKCSVEIEAPPIEVLNRILHERHKWDDDMLSWCVVERLDRHCDVFQYVLNSMAPHPPRHFMVLRYWRPDLVKGACALVSRSVEHSGWKGASEADYDQGVRAVELGSYYLMEPCGSGRSRLTYIARTDLRGRCPEWYNRVFGHLSANYLDRLRDSFRQETEGPETKV